MAIPDIVLLRDEPIRPEALRELDAMRRGCQRVLRLIELTVACGPRVLLPEALLGISP